MAVTASDILQYLSSDAGSTGGAISGSTTTSGVANNVWPDITDGERLAGGTKYRKTFWKNNHATDSMLEPVIYCPVLPTNMTLQIGLGVDSSDDGDSAQGNMTPWGTDAKVALVSDGADTRVATIYGMDNSGTPVPTTETVTLTGASEVLSVATYSKVWAVSLSTTDGSRVVTVKEGTGGTTRGTIDISKVTCWLWITAGPAKANGIYLPDLAAGQSYGVWRALEWSAGAGSVKPNSLTVAIEENA